MKKAPLYPILCGREFGAATLHVPSLLRWVASKGLYLHTEPPIGDYEIMQVEALLCDIERGAKPDNYEEAGVLVSCTPELAEHSNDPCSVWLVGAEAHRKWRDLLREAFKAGELQLLDFASLLPLKADEVHVTTAPNSEQPAGTEPEQVQHQGEPAAVQPKPDIGVSRDEIAKVFPPLNGQTPEQWKNMLRDARAKWLRPARLDAGRSGIQSRWNPAQLAICLAERRHMRRSQLGILMSKHFREYLPEWEAYAGSFEN